MMNLYKIPKLYFYRFLLVWFPPIYTRLFKLSAEGLENVPGKGPFLIIGNHSHRLDPFFIGALVRRPIFQIASNEYFRIPFMRRFMWAMGAIPIERYSPMDIRAIRHAIQLVKEGPGVNNFIPHDCVTALAMTRYLTFNKKFDYYISVAPEGFIYLYFFEIFNCNVLSVYVDFPPIHFETKDDLAKIENSEVLIIEDDIIGGATLRLVTENLQKYEPKSTNLFLGHTKGIQQIKNIPKEIEKTYIAEDILNFNKYSEYETDFVKLFSNRWS